MEIINFENLFLIVFGIIWIIGAILPLSYSWIINIKIFGFFILLFLLGGSIYALVYAFCLIIINRKNFKNEFGKQWNNYKKLFLIGLIFALVWTLLAFFVSQTGFILIGLVILLFPVLYVFAKAVEESCMIKQVSWNKVTEGDWLYKDVKVVNRLIKTNWEGVSKKELELIRKNRKKVLIKYGIPFTPSFLFGFVGLLFLAWKFGWLF